MREIKFRAWHLKYDQWPESSKKYTQQMDLNPCLGGGFNSDYECLVNNNHEGFSDPDTIWMQYTGLKDINGKEIYEGDVMESVEHEDNSRGKIVFERGCFLFEYEGWREKLLQPIEIDDLIRKYNQVIGNIYENPELLKS